MCPLVPQITFIVYSFIINTNKCFYFIINDSTSPVLAIFIIVALVWQRQPYKQRFTPRAAPAFYEPFFGFNPICITRQVILEYFTPQAAPAVYEPLHPEDMKDDDTSLAGPDYDNNGKAEMELVRRCEQTLQYALL